MLISQILSDLGELCGQKRGTTEVSRHQEIYPKRYAKATYGGVGQLDRKTPYTGLINNNVFTLLALFIFVNFNLRITKTITLENYGY